MAGSPENRQEIIPRETSRRRDRLNQGLRTAAGVLIAGTAVSLVAVDSMRHMAKWVPDDAEARAQNGNVVVPTQEELKRDLQNGYIALEAKGAEFRAAHPDGPQRDEHGRFS